jgi:hypothetical protein
MALSSFKVALVQTWPKVSITMHVCSFLDSRPVIDFDVYSHSRRKRTSNMLPSKSARQHPKALHWLFCPSIILQAGNRKSPRSP